MAEDWDIAIGTVTTRAKVAERFGGSPQNGISSSATSKNVMIYSDPAVGRRHGYNFDGWAADGAFYYTGDGQHGDQEFIRGNRSIRDHASREMALRVFEAVPEATQKGGKPQRYIGSFRLDPSAPWRRQESLDSDGLQRTVLVFKLLPVEAEPPAAEETLSDLPAAVPAQEFLPPENNVVQAYDVAAREGTVAERHEAELMAELEAALRSGGRKVGRLRLSVPESSVRLLTDTFDSTNGVLYEVKATSTRNMVRVAIGQLFDYRRFVNGLTHCCVVLPVRPAPDLVELIHALGFDLVARENGSLVRVTAAGLTDL
ncbi:hypothetical protein [Promicromonospora panici]|uniref:hypothetical protein n=1 Tax=Promicromonospora panici TaxID=2219658 RepID=UPI00101DFAB9|nr:hypothetical protein [Promicromonospora panici]